MRAMRPQADATATTAGATRSTNELPPPRRDCHGRQPARPATTALPSTLNLTGAASCGRGRHADRRHPPVVRARRPWSKCRAADRPSRCWSAAPGCATTSRKGAAATHTPGAAAPGPPFVPAPPDRGPPRPPRRPSHRRLPARPARSPPGSAPATAAAASPAARPARFCDLDHVSSWPAGRPAAHRTRSPSAAATTASSNAPGSRLAPRTRRHRHLDRPHRPRSHHRTRSTP